MSRLNCFVYVTDETGGVHAFGPDSALPAWARDKISNPNVWAKDDKTEAAPEADAVDDDHGDGPPPQGGAGASRAKWAAYAEANNVVVQEDWKREDIIAACEAAGVAV
ncbi:hypothetical protein [Nocardia spumae]|uniref:hypothetical protein n=1 Tax=Nocardia spumae TaxID=2887190 RepID=UPI001D154063|nr:hypothetical protein [Nocardia spumae]